MSSTGKILLWLFVVSLGIEIGAGIYEMRVSVPLWSSSPPESLIAYQSQEMSADPGRRFWMFWTPLVGLISLANLPFAWRSAPPRRGWWVFGSGMSVAVVLATFLYFVPVLMDLQRASELPANEVVTKVQWWVRLNFVRAVAYIAAWLSALKAFSYGG